jgi:membrane associated rhomboid family serine protease
VLGVFVTRMAVPAYVMLGYWFVLQLLLGTVGTLSKFQGGVAFWAHVGGFIAGLLLIKLFANPELARRHEAAAAGWQGF